MPATNRQFQHGLLPVTPPQDTSHSCINLPRGWVVTDFYHPLIDIPVPYAFNLKSVELGSEGVLIGGTLEHGAENDTVVSLEEVKAGTEPTTANPHGGNIYQLKEAGSRQAITVVDSLPRRQYLLDIMIPMFELTPVSRREMGDYITEDGRRFNGCSMSVTSDTTGISRLPTGQQLLWRHLAESIPVQLHESEMLRRLQFQVGPGGSDSSSTVRSDDDNDEDDGIKSSESDDDVTIKIELILDDGDKIMSEDSDNDVDVKLELTDDDDDAEIKIEDKRDDIPVKIELASRMASPEPERAVEDALDLRISSWLDDVASRYRSTTALKRSRDDDEQTSDLQYAKRAKL